MDLFALPPELLKISQGGDQFKGWLGQTLNDFLKGTAYLAVAIKIAVQIGSDAGAVIKVPCFAANFDKKTKYFDIWRQELEKFNLSFQPGSSLRSTAVDSETVLITCAISELLDRPIGLLCLVARTDDFNIASRQATLLSTRIALTIRAVKQVIATQYLTSPYLYYGSPLNDLAEWCRKTISAAAVIIWKKSIESPDSASPAHTVLRTAGSSPVVSFDMRSTEGIPGYAYEKQQLIRIDDLLNDDEIYQVTRRKIAHKEVLNRGWRSAVYLPLSDGKEVLGVMAAYGVRKSGFNSLDVEISLQCANYVTHRLRIDNDYQEIRNYQTKMEELAGEVDIARYFIVGRVHDAANNLRFADLDLEQIKASEQTQKYLDAARTYVRDTRTFIRTLRDKFQVDKTLAVAISNTQIKPFIEEQLRPLRADCLTRRIELKLNCDHDEMLAVDKFRLSSIIYNIIQNSIQNFAYIRGREKKITISVTASQEILRLQFHDNGPGIEPSVVNKVWQPFFSTRGGMGLGLAMVKKYVSDLGGDVDLKTRWGEFTEIKVELPCQN